MATVPGSDLLLKLLAKKRAGMLHGDDQGVYRATVDAFLQLAVEKQNASPTAHPARRHVRIARSIEVDLTSARVSGRCLSLDVGFGGFSALVAKPLDLDGTFVARLRLRGEEWISPRVQVASVQRRSGVYRVSFAFVALSDEDRDRLELAILSDLLSKLAPTARPTPRPTESAGVSGQSMRCAC